MTSALAHPALATHADTLPEDDHAADILRTARRLLAAGEPRPVAAAELAATVSSRPALERAQCEIIRRMHKPPSVNFAATALLRLVESALRLLPHDLGRARPRRRIHRPPGS